MDLKKIITISGYPEVFKIIKESRKGFIVESLQTGKRMQAFLHYKISSLEDIAIFTETGEIPLKDVFKRIYEKENGQKTIDPKKASPEEIKQKFEEILPEYDKERVYMSDMKKVFRWYNLLVEKGLLKFDEEEKAEDKQEETSEEQAKEENK